MILYHLNSYNDYQYIRHLMIHYNTEHINTQIYNANVNYQLILISVITVID